jgi:hypothetical protein
MNSHEEPDQGCLDLCIDKSVKYLLRQLCLRNRVSLKNKSYIGLCQINHYRKMLVTRLVFFVLTSPNFAGVIHIGCNKLTIPSVNSCRLRILSNFRVSSWILRKLGLNKLIDIKFLCKRCSWIFDVKVIFHFSPVKNHDDMRMRPAAKNKKPK